ncbi:MAG: site-specific DNA-methyltransferase, partial [Candidatus Heimdallarchaeota archaeon]|nr:site-specific DNA-methyltransferase [Candidatus Heimdallarchaeota archaeon]MCK5145086.1 site-specific DNA-methyltransferase [Candidatus Heimdallarchaeota archaeon]
MNLSSKNLIVKDKKTVLDYPLEDILNKTLFGDALAILKKIPSDSVDLVFLDPPYYLQLPKKQLKRWNVKTSVDAVDDDWDKFDSFEEYDTFIQSILVETQRIMKEKAALWIISTYHSIHRIGKIMQDLGYWLLSDVLWLKSNPMPNWLGVRFTNATETLIWAVKDKDVKKNTFNKTMAKKYGIGKVGANVWVIPLCTGKERMKDEEGKKLHSTQKPIELLKRIILTTSKEEDVVLDPMAGLGTTGYVANALNRKFIMIEKEEKYIKGIQRRFSEKLHIDFEKEKIRKNI